MPSIIIRSTDVPDDYEKWTREVLQELGPNVVHGEGNKVLFKSSIRTTVDRVYLLNQESYDRTKRSDESSPFLTRAKIGRLESYQRPIVRGVAPREFYRDLPDGELDTSVAYWRPMPPRGQADQSGVFGEIYVCIDQVREISRRISPRLPDVDKSRIEEYFFKACLHHEFGHHYSMANFTYDGIPDESERDMFVIEGMAGWFAYMRSGIGERRVQAEYATLQKPPYRIYQYLKHADVTKLLHCFMSVGNYRNVPSAFSYVIGGIHNLNGYLMSVDGPYDGVFIDWSGRGGQLVAKTAIKATTSMTMGCIISSRIDLLVGRYPPEVLVVAGKIGKYIDYGILPPNIKLVDSRRIESAIEDHKRDPSTTLTGNVLAELGFDNDNLFR